MHVELPHTWASPNSIPGHYVTLGTLTPLPELHSFTQQTFLTSPLGARLCSRRWDYSK